MSTEDNLENTLTELAVPLKVNKINIDESKSYQLDKTQDWVKDLLVELNEKADEQTPEEYLLETSLNIDIDMIKKFKPEEGEFLLVTGSVRAQYVTQCIRSLESMSDEFDIEFKVCYLHSKNKEHDAYKDQLETFQLGDMYELYFYEKGDADLKAVIHETIYLNLNQYPVKDPDGELPWQKLDTGLKQ
jgi:uncharacterized metal-binding protein YceD (DUF177 family)